MSGSVGDVPVHAERMGVDVHMSKAFDRFQWDTPGVNVLRQIKATVQ